MIHHCACMDTRRILTSMKTLVRTWTLAAFALDFIFHLCFSFSYDLCRFSICTSWCRCVYNFSSTCCFFAVKLPILIDLYGSKIEYVYSHNASGSYYRVSELILDGSKTYLQYMLYVIRARAWIQRQFYTYYVFAYLMLYNNVLLS